MTDTQISDAVAFPQDDGTGVSDGSEDYTSAGYFGLLSRNVNGEYVANGLSFANVDTTNEQVDVTAGHAFIEANQNTTTVQSGSQKTYDTDLPSGSNITYVVVLPTDEPNLGLGTDTNNDLWLFIDPTANDSVYIRHGSGLSSPESDATPKPSIKLGTVNSSDGSTTRANDDIPIASSVFGRVGDVVAQAGDYAASQISNFSSEVISSISGSSISPSSVTTEYASTDNVSGVDLGPHQPTLQSQNARFSWQDIDWEDKGAAILDGSSTGDGSAGYSTLLHAESVLDNPIDTWHLYWSTHDFNYIALHTASSPWGPWSFHSKVLSDSEGSQTASPSVLYDPQRDRLNLYYHTDPGDQHTKLATSPTSGNGTAWTEQGTVLEPQNDLSWDEQERSYLRAYRIGAYFLAVYQGRDTQNNAAGIGVATSVDGEQWTVDASPAFDNTHWAADGATQQDYLGGIPALSFIGGELTIHYNDRTVDEARALPYRFKDTAPMAEGETVYTTQSWMDSSKGPAVNDFAIDGEHLYMLYHTEPFPANIGVARANLGEIL